MICLDAVLCHVELAGDLFGIQFYIMSWLHRISDLKRQACFSLPRGALTVMELQCSEFKVVNMGEVPSHTVEAMDMEESSVLELIFLVDRSKT